MSDSPEVRLLQHAWEAMAQGDLTVLENSLAVDAQWLGAEDGQLCGNRKAILEVLRLNLPSRLQGTIEETIQDGPCVIAAFRPKQPAQVNRPLDEGIAYAVVTIRNGKITELKGCPDRASAISYAATSGDEILQPPIRSRLTSSSTTTSPSSSSPAA